MIDDMGKRVFTLGLGAALAVSLGLALFGCGTASNNDQGTSFLALGFFADDSGSTGASGMVLPLHTDELSPAAAGGYGLLTTVNFGIRNRLSKQYIQTSHVECDYRVQQSSLVVPSDSHTFSTIVEPGGDLYPQIEILSPDLYAFLNLNHSSLPELPFRMNITCRMTGVSQAGDVLTTNDVTTLVQFVDLAEAGSSSGGSAGDFDGFGDPFPEPGIN